MIVELVEVAESDAGHIEHSHRTQKSCYLVGHADIIYILHRSS